MRRDSVYARDDSALGMFFASVLALGIALVLILPIAVVVAIGYLFLRMVSHAPASRS